MWQNSMKRTSTERLSAINTECKRRQSCELDAKAIQRKPLKSFFQETAATFRPVTRALATKQRSQAPTTGFLFLCFVSYDVSVSYSVRKIKAARLFSNSDEGNKGGKSSSSSSSSSASSDFSDAGNKGGKSSSASSDLPSQRHEVQFPSSGDGNCFGMGCGTSGSKLYLLGGQNPVKKSSSGTTLLESSDSDTESEDTGGLHDYSARVFTLDLESSVYIESSDSESCYVASEAREMLSGMASPLVITVEEKLYVLARTAVSMMPDYPFEVYDPKNNSWEELPSAPFLNPNSMFSQDPQIRSYVVIDNKIHVSTSSASFSFDTTTKEWKSCTLFDDPNFKRHRRQWMNTTIIPYPPNNNAVYGPPFDFNCGAVMYGGDVMICLVSSIGHVVAYELVGGKVKRTQRLKELEIPLDATSAYLADFGDGYFCLLFNSNNCPPDCQIFITPFQVSKIKSDSSPKAKMAVESEFPPTGKMTNFLDCSPRQTHSFKVSASSTDPPSKNWSFIGCFVSGEGR